MSTIPRSISPVFPMLDSSFESIIQEFMEREEKIISVKVAKLEDLIFEASYSKPSVVFSNFPTAIELIDSALLIVEKDEALYEYLCKILETRFTKLLDILVNQSFFLKIRNSCNYETMKSIFTPKIFQCVLELLDFVYITSKNHKIQIEDEITSEILFNIKWLSNILDEKLKQRELDFNTFKTYSLKLDQTSFSYLKMLLAKMKLNILRNCKLSDILINSLDQEIFPLYNFDENVDEIRTLLLRYDEIENDSGRMRIYTIYKKFMDNYSRRKLNLDEYILLEDLSSLFKEISKRELCSDNTNYFSGTIKKYYLGYPINYERQNYKYYLKSNKSGYDLTENEISKNNRVNCKSNLDSINNYSYNKNITLTPASREKLNSKTISQKTTSTIWGKFKGIINIKKRIHFKRVILHWHHKSYKV